MKNLRSILSSYSLILLLSGSIVSCSAPADKYIDFLYANMALPDSIDYDRAFYEEQVGIALRARTEMPWGRTVPEREFRHFVLPPRVSNEDLDDFRTTYYEELAARVGGKSMTDAILEVNHWCHEHVTYRPTSARTLGPASTVRTAYGRCGEESVLLVAALRTVGIPARQVYTPRWAHTDDNHAWVEAWADGRWHFLGACEPEPVLDLGWFNESASRGMLMHTKVFGRYDGPEDVVKQEPNLTEINVTANYAPTRRVTVEVLDTLGHPVTDACVEFKIYNYAEFFTVATFRSDADGHSSLTAGLGDMLVCASTPDAVATAKISFATDSLVKLTLRPMPKDFDVAKTFECNIDIAPPPSSATLPEVSAEARAENDRRLAYEDSIRHAYEATMPDQRSRGNHAVIAAFRDSAAARGQEYYAEQLITALPDKDLQDVSLDVLLDCLNMPLVTSHSNTEGHHDLALTDIARTYLLSPRIERERLTAFRAPLRAAFSALLSAATATAEEPPSTKPLDDSAVASLIAWTRDSLRIVDNRNPQRLRITPIGVYRSRQADKLSRDIFFVAACRSIGIPARINEIDSKVQYINDKGSWTDVEFDKPTADTAAKGTLKITYHPSRFVPDAKYYTHFTISKLGADNRLQLLTFPEEATAMNTFAAGVELDEGTYVRVSGTRLADGSVLATQALFRIAAGQTTYDVLELRQNDDRLAVIGSLNAENLYQPLAPLSSGDRPQGSPVSLLSTCGRGYYVLGLIAPNQEPTNHALRDIALVGSQLEAWGRKIVLLFSDAEAAGRFNFAEFTNMPSTVVWGTDIDGAILREAIEQQHLTSSSLPIFLICDSFNRVVYVQQGYTIGLGEQLYKVIQKLNSPTNSAHYSFADERLSCSITAEMPEATLRPAVAEWLAAHLGYTHTGDKTDIQALVDFCGEKQKKELSMCYDEGVPDYAELSYDAEMEKVYETDKVVTYGLTVDVDLGGAHPSHDYWGATFRKDNGRQLTWAILRDDRKAAFKAKLHDKLKEHFDADSDAELKDNLLEEVDVNDIPLPADPPYMLEDGFAVFYQQYEIAPYAMGMPGGIFTYQQMKPFLKEDIQQLLP